MTLQARITTNKSQHIPLVNESYKKHTRSTASLRCISQAGNIQCKSCSLRTHCLAKSVNEDGMTALSNITYHPKPAQKGEHFFRQDDNFDAIYIVHSGAIKTYRLDENGDEHITGFYLPGELLGVDGLTSGKHKLSAQALNTTTVCVVPFKKLEKTIHDHPSLQRRMLEMLCAEMQDRQQPLLLLRHKPAENLLATFLVDISKRFNARNLSAIEFDLPMPRRDIASHLGLADETMSRLFTRFQKQGLLSTKGRTVKIADLETLQTMSTTMN